MKTVESKTCSSGRVTPPNETLVQGTEDITNTDIENNWVKMLVNLDFTAQTDHCQRLLYQGHYAVVWALVLRRVEPSRVAQA